MPKQPKKQFNHLDKIIAARSTVRDTAELFNDAKALRALARSEALRTQTRVTMHLIDRLLTEVIVDHGGEE